jgi:hypothetical protein
LQEREDEINPHPEELPRTAEKAARLVEEWAMRLDWQQRDLERMRLLTREHGEPVSSPWSNSRIHETEELVQKMQQLERENAELRRDVYQCPPTSENDYEGLTWSDAFEVLERENAALRADAERYRYIKNSETVEVSGILQTFCVSMTFDLDAAIDAYRTKEGGAT